MESLVFENHVVRLQRFIRGHLVRRKQHPRRFINYYYQKFLKEKGVKLPQEKTQFSKVLDYLYIHLKKEIHISELRKYVNGWYLGVLIGCDTLQVRHLGLQYGYYLLKGGDIWQGKKIKSGYYMLVNLFSIHSGFHCQKRKISVHAKEWNDLLLEYHHSCACCGNKENEPMRWNQNKITILQKGHKDPRKPLTYDNCIPQCDFCNLQYKNKAIFNDRGVVIDFNKKGFN